MKIEIIGGGIAGLACAISLRLKGCDVVVYEQAARLQEIGAGLQISPNGCRVLTLLGVEVENEYEPEKVIMRKGTTGKLVFDIPLRKNAEKRWKERFIHIHRQDLQKALYERAVELGIVVELGARIGASDLAARQEKLSAQGGYLIGADGIRSATRQWLFGDDKIKFTGRVAYRCLVPLQSLVTPPAPSAIIWAGNKQHAVTTRLNYGDVVNFVGICDEVEWKEEGWDRDIEPECVQEKFKGWHPTIGEILMKAEEVKQWALLERKPLEHFHKGNVVLVGDAAHPMLPSFAQGAVQALEDAYILAECLELGALSDYEAMRQKRVRKVQRASQHNLKHYHYGKFGQFLYYNGAWILDKIAPRALYLQLDWLYKYDVKSEVRSYF